MFKASAGKRERARLQIAYSRACIEIGGVLIKHGLSSLPKSQHVEAQSLNSLVVAVMGVSVKYREDLRKMFGEEAGRRSEEHTSVLQSLIRISYAVVCWKTKIHAIKLHEDTEIVL